MFILCNIKELNNMCKITIFNHLLITFIILRVHEIIINRIPSLENLLNLQMINFLKQLIELIKNVTNYAMKNKVFRYLYKAFLFISSLYIVKIFSIFWRYTRKIWSLLSAVLLLVIADFNFSNIITAFSLIVSSLPSYINNGIVNLWLYINNKFSYKNIKNVPPISPPINREEITDIITDDKIEYEPFPGRHYRRIYKAENHNFGSETFFFWENYGYYIFGSVVLIVIIGGTYYYYGDDIKTYITKYFPGFFRKENSNDRDRGSGSAPKADSSSFNTIDENILSDDSDSGSEIEETFNEVSRYFRTPVDNSKNTPLLVDNSVQTKTRPSIDSSVQTDSSSNSDNSVQTDITPHFDYKNTMLDILDDEDSESTIKTFFDNSVQTDVLPNIDSSVQTDSSSNIDNSVQTDSSLKGDNDLDDATKNEILQLFSQISPENLNLEDIEDTINPTNHPAASEVLETSLVKNSPPLKKGVRFIEGQEERLFKVTDEEFESKKKGYKFWLESSSKVYDSDYSPSPISPLEVAPWRSQLSSYRGRFSNNEVFTKFSEIVLEQQSPEELSKAILEFNKLNTEKFIEEWLEAKSKNISAIDFIQTKTYLIYPITKKLLLNILENA